MKRLLTSLSLLTAIVSMGMTSSWAVFTSVQKSSVTATVTTGGTKNASFNLAILNLNTTTPASPAQINWSNVDPAVTSWKVADQMIKLGWNVSDANGGIQIYTDNKNPVTPSVTNPAWVDPTPAISSNTDSNPAGLLYASGLPTTTSALPMAWSIKATTGSIVAAEPNDNIGHGQAVDNPNSFQWLYMVDKNTPAIDRNGNNVLGDAADSAAFPAPTGYFVRMIQGAGFNGLSGIHFGQADNEFAGDPDKTSYVYFQSEFSGAAALSTYKTTTLTVEAFIQ